MLLSLLLGLSVLWGSAQIPNGYYNDANGKAGYELKTALHNIIKKGHVDKGYSALYDAYVKGDTDPNDGYLWDMYSENPNGKDPYNYTHGQKKCGNYKYEGDCYNREHVLPQSVFYKGYPMRSDYHHVIPSDGKVNGQRSSYPFGEVGTANWTSLNGSKRGNSVSAGYTSTVFEPLDEFKGDIARCLLYVGTRYEDVITGWKDHAMLNHTKDQVFSDWFLEVLLKWHEQDPVSQKEIVRNNAGYDFQGNRNPFIDHPEYVCEIWGSDCSSATKVATPKLSVEGGTYSSAQTVSISCATSDVKIYYTLDGSTPTASSELYSNPINVNKSLTLKCYAKKENLEDSELVTAEYIIQSNTAGGSLNEDFESVVAHKPIALSGWKNIAEKGSVVWEGKTHNDNKYAQVKAYKSPDTDNVAWLISPAIKLNSVKTVNLVFETKDGFNNTKSGEGLFVYISENFNGGNTPWTATWTKVNCSISNVAPSNNYAENFLSSGKIDLSAYVNKTVYIAFKYIGGKDKTTTTYQIDNVIVKSTGETSNEKPVISGLSVNPATPTVSDAITFYANASDSDGSIAKVELLYGKANDNLSNTVSMSLKNGKYEYELAKQAAGTIYYKIKAVDNDNAETLTEVKSITVSSSSGTDDVEANTFKIYPNPCEKQLNIQLDEEGEYFVQVFSSTGKMHYQMKYNASGAIEVPVDHFPSGVYFIKIESKEKSRTQKFIKK